MYLAVKKIKGVTRYILRESYGSGSRMRFRDIFDLGPEPSEYIDYIGHNAFYFDENLEDCIRDRSEKEYDSEELEDLLWPWIRPDVRQAIYTFKNRSSPRRAKLTETEKARIASDVHDFDKRRIHYLKFQNMEQGPVENMPSVLFRNLPYQSRDEIEQNFLRQESRLKPHELKSYVYTVFNVQRHFASFMAKKMPHVLDQDRVDDYFLSALCELNESLFHKTDTLDEYMIRYVIMFFDNPYGGSRLLDDFAKEFMNRHRFFAQRSRPAVSTEKACRIFNISRPQLKQMSRQELSKIYHRLAMNCHPDIGGSHERFVELGNAYKSLLEQLV